VDHGHIQLAVIVEISHSQRLRGASCGVRYRPSEGSISVTEQQTQGVVEIVANHQIELAVTIEIAHSNTERTIAGGEIRGEAEGPVTVAQSHDYGIVSVIGYYKIRLAIAVKVANPHRFWGVRKDTSFRHE